MRGQVNCQNPVLPGLKGAGTHLQLRLKWNFMRIALGQINPTVGDLAGNTAKMTAFSRDASQLGAELIAFPELSVTGYPPRDLVEKESFVRQSEEALQHLAEQTASLPIAILTGYVGRSYQSTGKCATNSAAVLQQGKVIFRQTKVLLPTYDVFTRRIRRPTRSPFAGFRFKSAS